MKIEKATAFAEQCTLCASHMCAIHIQYAWSVRKTTLNSWATYFTFQPPFNCPIQPHEIRLISIRWGNIYIVDFIPFPHKLLCRKWKSKWKWSWSFCAWQRMYWVSRHQSAHLSIKMCHNMNSAHNGWSHSPFLSRSQPRIMEMWCAHNRYINLVWYVTSTQSLCAKMNKRCS